jgi:hypothetical protein
MNILKLVEGIFSIGVGVAGFFYIL